MTIIGIDNMNDYYDVRLKEARLTELSAHHSFVFVKGSIADKTLLEEVFDKYRPQIVVNLAAQAGVRYAIINPDAYVECNLIRFYNILEIRKRYHSKNIIFSPEFLREGKTLYGNVYPKFSVT